MVETLTWPQTYIGSIPDFEGEGYSSTFHVGKIFDCWECPDCGRSVTKDMRNEPRC